MLTESLRGFKIHTAVYVLVNSALAALNILLVIYTNTSFFWFPFPLVCWGIGLRAHYIFGVRKAEQEIQKRQTRIERLATRPQPVTSAFSDTQRAP
jgi:hypothetical protein